MSSSPAAVEPTTGPTDPTDPIGTTAGAAGTVWIVLGAISIGFHLWLVFSGLVPNLVSRPLHLALALPWILFAGAGAGAGIGGGVGGLAGPFGRALGALAIAACLWIAWRHDALSDQYGYLAGAWQFGIAAVLLIAVLEAARRAIGWPLPAVALLALLYGLFGEHVPGSFGHGGLPWASLLGTLTIAEGGLWGSLTGVSVGIVAVFVILGAVLNAGEAGEGFTWLRT